MDPSRPSIFFCLSNYCGADTTFISIASLAVACSLHGTDAGGRAHETMQVASTTFVRQNFEKEGGSNAPSMPHKALFAIIVLWREKSGLVSCNIHPEFLGIIICYGSWLFVSLAFCSRMSSC